MQKKRKLTTNVDKYEKSSLKKNTNKLNVTAVAQWLRCCATNRKVAGSIPDDVIGTIH